MKHNVIFGLVYTVTYFVLSVIPVNAEGRGPIIFFAPCFTWLLVLIALYFSKRVESFVNQIIFVLLLFVHYLVTALIVLDSLEDQYPRIEKMIGWGETWLLYLIGAWYVTGQVFIWISFLRARSNHRMRGLV